MSDISNEAFEQLSTIFIKKDREQEHDQAISSQWIKTRSRFFTNQTIDRLSKVKLGVKKKNIQMLFKLGLHSPEEQDPQAKSLHQQLNKIQSQFKRKEKECLPLVIIIQKQITNLNIIRIQYKPKFDELYFQSPYSISSFELFKLIHKNQKLHQVTLRGIMVQQLQQFIAFINPKKIEKQENEQLVWIRHFNPQKQLKMSINASLKFVFQNEAHACSLTDDLLYFTQLFHSLSEITIVMKLGDWNFRNDWLHHLENLFQCIRAIKKISIRLQGGYLKGSGLFRYQNQINSQVASYMRLAIFGKLASFSQIAQLSFRTFKFTQQVCVNDFLAMEQILEAIFANNTITRLEVSLCRKFPIFPKLKTLESIYIRDIYFRKPVKFMGDLSKTNSSLQSISSIQNLQPWTISDDLFNRLSALILKRSDFINFDDIRRQLPSKLEYLSICHSIVGIADSLFLIFPKLFHLISLELQGVDFGNQVLCLIPSPFLRNIIISTNNTFNNQGLKDIDLKWPQLRQLTLRYCPNITDSIWSACQFKGLRRLRADHRILGEQKRSFQSRGIKVNQQ